MHSPFHTPPPSSLLLSQNTQPCHKDDLKGKLRHHARPLSPLTPQQAKGSAITSSPPSSQPSPASQLLIFK